MRRIVVLAGVALLALSALSATSRGADNQPPAGFVALFSGHDLAGWKGLVENPIKRAQMSPDELAAAQKKADDDMRKHWQAKDGVLLFDGGGQSICTATDYSDFELLVDWKIEKDGDSGIYLRGTPQVQIWDPDCTAAKGVGSGGLYNNKPPDPSQPLLRADNPVGQWNTFDITMVGDKVTVKLNGKLVTDNVTLQNFWDYSKPIFPSGQIELQNHGNTLYFKNIYLKELPR